MLRCKTGWNSGKTDGRPESGTVMVKDITPGTDPWGGPKNFIVFDNALYFSANGGSGKELWKSDGTASGTVLVKDIYPEMIPFWRCCIQQPYQPN